MCPSSLHVVSLRICIYVLPLVYTRFIPRPWDKFSLTAFSTNIRYLISFENVAKLKYLRTIVTDINLIREEIMSTYFGNVCYSKFYQNILSSRLLSKTVTIKIYKIIILLVVLYRCETWSLPLREEHSVRGVWESSASENICIQDGWLNRRLKKST
jgi:hypothetical protein